MIVNESHNGQTVQVKAGEPIEVHLPENGSIGQRWMLSDMTSIKATEDQYDHTSGKIGGGGIRKMKFVAPQQGSGIIKLVQERSWAKGDFMVNVEVV
jgi:predicted secreted protein